MKHESSTLVQIRTGKIGLNAFLHRRRVPGIQPECHCGTALETAFHLATDCIDTEESRSALTGLIGPIDIRCDFADAVGQPEHAKAIAKWMLATGRLKQFQHAVDLGGESQEVRGRRRKAGMRRRQPPPTAVPA